MQRFQDRVECLLRYDSSQIIHAHADT